MSVPAFAHTYRSGSRPVPRSRGITAVATSAGLLCAIAMAPLTAAQAYEGGPYLPTPAGEAQQQAFVTAASDAEAIELSIDAEEGTAGAGTAASPALFTLDQFMFTGAIHWQGYRFTYYSQQVLPGPGLAIPGRHVNEDGFVSDADGFIVLAGDAPKGTVFQTPFGRPGKIYDRGTFGNHLDVYIR